MSKDVHNMDDIFNSAYRRFEEDPSTDVWEKINADLDKKEAESYKKRFIGWRRAAILLLLLLAWFILYESVILKTGPGHSEENIQLARGTKKPDSLAVQYQTTDQDHTLTNKAGDGKPDFINKEISNQENNRTSLIITQDRTRVREEVDKNTGEQKFMVSNREVKTAGDSDQMELNINSPTLSKNTKEVFKSNESSGIEKVSFPLLEKNHTGGYADILVYATRKAQLLITLDSLVKSSIAKKAKQKRTSLFKPFWMMTGFASFDQTGYKLDSDEPSAISSIKYREAHEPSFSAGILLTRQLTPCWGFQTGLFYATTAIGMKPQKTYAFRDPTGDIAYKYITSSGYAYIKPEFGPQPAVGDSLTTAEAKHTIENISVPLAVKYTLSGKKISLTPGAGIEANFITKANLEVDIEDPFNREILIVRKLNGTKSFYWSFVADAELRYNLNKKMFLTIRPVFRHAITAISENNIVETFPHSFGLGAGITIKL